MTDISAQMKPEAMEMHGHSPGVVLRSLVIGLTAFLTVVLTIRRERKQEEEKKKQESG